MCAAADRGFTWSDDETSALLTFWGAHDSQNVTPGNKRNFVIYETISEKMLALGFYRSTSQCREKIKRMKREYTLTKQYNNSTDGPKKTMRFFDQFEKILLEKQSRNQRNTTLSARAIVAAVENRIPQYDQWTSQNGKNMTESSNDDLHSPLALDMKEEQDPWAPDVVLVEGDETQSYQGESPPKKKRKVASSSRMEMFENMMDAVTTKFIHYQQQTDSKFLAQLETLEKERQAADEKMQKMWLEFEEKRRKDEQQHELRILSAFKDILSQITANHKVKTP